MFLERKLRHQDVCLFGAMFRKYLSMYGAIVSCELIFFFLIFYMIEVNSEVKLGFLILVVTF